MIWWKKANRIYEISLFKIRYKQMLCSRKVVNHKGKRELGGLETGSRNYAESGVNSISAQKAQFLKAKSS